MANKLIKPLTVAGTQNEKNKQKNKRGIIYYGAAGNTFLNHNDAD